VPAASVSDEQLLISGYEAGTAPEDRRFRPDVEGLRAVAVILVVLYHANVPFITGGYVGVDVFFVISGFVITGLLLRDLHGTGHISIINFYARRLRRILPAATLVILITVFASYVLLGYVYGNNVADDGRWAALFLSNFHFEAVGSNYLTAFRPPSPLQNYWSLSVEEQFYVVYPTIFLLVASQKGRFSVQVKMPVALGAVIIASYWLSVVQTASHPNAAYYSPFTRAWELALGALVAVGTPWLKQIPIRSASFISWSGLVAIVFAAFAFTAETSYPGSLVAVPVVGAGLVIAGGVAVPRSGAESLLGLRPFRWLGQRSYSLYLWHWPILIIAARYAGKSSLSYKENLILVGAAVLISIPSYTVVENPIRRLHIRPKASVAMGIGVIILTVAVLSLVISAETAPLSSYVVRPVASTQVLLHQVGAATSITKVPKDLEPVPSQVGSYWGGNYEDPACQASTFQWDEHICIHGDPTAKRLMVVYGDSHAAMWLPAFERIASSAHWKLVILAKDYCPAELVTIVNQKTWPRPNGPDLICDHWHKWAVDWINNNKPKLLVITQENIYQTPAANGGSPKFFTRAEWSTGLSSLLDAVRVPGIRKVFLGNTPTLSVAGGTGPSCLADHPTDVQACTVLAQNAVVPLNYVDQSTAKANGTEYVNTVPWFCSTKCTAIINKYGVYLDAIHINAVWAIYLQNVLSRAIGISGSSHVSYSIPAANP
jgi:peptidoglycan/LPS O-acetylase OafA/YrhL